jgi:uncharacterized protein
MRRPLRFLIFVLLAFGLVPGCRRAADESRAEAVALAEAPRGPWTPPPSDSLYGATATENLRILEVVVEARGIPRGWDGMRVALLSDLLIGAWRDNAAVAAAAVRAALEAEPDLVVLAGNVVGAGGGPTELREVLRALGARPSIAVLGVRDVRTDSLATAVAAELRGAGITVLRNEATGLVRGEDIGFIVGIEPVTGTTSPSSVSNVLATLPEEAVTPLLISNLPGILDAAPEGRFPVVLSGNTFCGTIEVPGTPRFAELVEGPLAHARVPRVNRLFHSRGTVLFVGCGTGYSFVPSRWGAAPEVAIITLHRIAERQPLAAEAVVEP